MENDTIAAISTPVGKSGIGIVRVSGKDAILICEKIYQGVKKLSDYDSHTINYGYIINDGEKIDEVMVSLMRAPHSYTKEDVVEINETTDSPVISDDSQDENSQVQESETQNGFETSVNEKQNENSADNEQ